MNRKGLLISILALLCMCANLATGGLVGYWPFDEGSGTAVQDSSGNDFSGELIGDPQWVTGKIGTGALSFDGSDGLVEVPEAPALDMTDRLTIATWVNVTDFTTYYFLVCKSPSGTAGDNYPGNYEFRVQSNTGLLEFGHQTSQGQDYVFYASTVALTAGKWYHAAVTFEKGEAVQFYIDGVPAGTVAQSANFGILNDEPIRIGGRKDNYSYFNGQIDDVRVYNLVLTDEQIQGLCTGVEPTFTNASRPDPANGTIGVGMPLFQWSKGETALFHNVYVGTVPDLTDADLKAERQPMTMYYLMEGLTPGATYYWRVDEIASDGVTIHTGDVWSFIAQDTKAYHPTPADMANTAPLDPTLTWMPGIGAGQHHVYFGDNAEAVAQTAADTDKGLLTEATFEPGTLEPLATYFWRVDESVLGDEIIAGPVWSFTTALPVDDFESYTDDEGQRIYETWVDGWTNATGSQVGNLDAPFAEQTIIHGGLQSMPMDYNNVNTPFYSEAEQQFTPTQDWTAGGTDTLLLCIRGQVSNDSAPLYVRIEDSAGNTASVVHSDPAIVTAMEWTQWELPLSDFAGVNMTRVKTLILGVGDRADPKAGGTGRIYIDGICLTKP